MQFMNNYYSVSIHPNYSFLVPYKTKQISIGTVAALPETGNNGEDDRRNSSGASF